MSIGEPLVLSKVEGQPEEILPQLILSDCCFETASSREAVKSASLDTENAAGEVRSDGLAASEEQVLARKIDLSLGRDRWNSWRNFGNAFREILSATIEGRGIEFSNYTNINSGEAALLAAIASGYGQEVARNARVAASRGISDAVSAIQYLAQDRSIDSSGPQLSEENVIVQRPHPGIIRFFVSDEVFRALDKSGVTAAALARTAHSPEDTETVAYTIYRRSLMQDARYVGENIPHETQHTLWGPVSTTIGLGRSIQVLAEKRDFEQFAFAAYLDEGLAQLAGGEIHSYCSPMRNSKFREAFDNHDSTEAAAVQSAIDDLYSLFNESDFKELLIQAELQPSALSVFFLGSSSLPELRDNLFALHRHLAESLSTT